MLLIDKNYRPVSNLSFVSKLIEKAACVPLWEAALQNGNVYKFQSAYREKHSAETALLRVKEDILKAINERLVICVLLLDLRATFDTISVDLLLNCLKFRFGFTGDILEWLRSYLTERNQTVTVEGQCSQPRQLLQGAPQGSILGSILFSLYISPVASICGRHNMNHHCYADDTQNYQSFSPRASNGLEDGLGQLSKCVDEIIEWMSAYLLKINTDKTELIMFVSPSHVSLYGETRSELVMMTSR